MATARGRLIGSILRQVAKELSRAGASAAPGRIGALPQGTPRRGDRLVGAVAHWGLYLAVVAAVVAFFSAALGRGTWQDITRVVIGAVLAAEGALLFTNWRGARLLLLRRLLARSQRRFGEPSSLVEIARWRLFGPLLAVLALVAVTVGLILVGQAAANLA